MQCGLLIFCKFSIFGRVIRCVVTITKTIGGQDNPGVTFVLFQAASD